jgi:YD repeat-containing protein
MEPAFAPTSPTHSFWTLLTGITDETGTRTANYTYDATSAYYRKVTTEGAGAVGRFEVTPSEWGTNVIGPLGTRYYTSLSPVLGYPRITRRQRCDAANANCASLFSIDYNANGNIATYSDARGFSTGYAYDAGRNLEVRRTEAVGTPAARTILTSWHPVWPIPTEIKVHSGGVDGGGVPTGPLLNRTTFVYDTAGNLTSRSEIDTGAVPTTRTWSWTYTTFGRVLTETDPNNRVTTYTYHSDTDPVPGKRGNRATMRNAAGHLTQYTAYDANARPTTVVDPNGTTTTLSYHPRGWLTVAAVSNGTSSRTTTIQYWANGKVKQVTQPDTSFLAMGYDAAQRLTSVRDSLGNSVTYTLDGAGNRTDEQVKDTSATLRQRVTRVFDTLDRLQSVTGESR